MLKSEIVLGQKVKDLVTGFTGIALARVDFLNGCCQLSVKPVKLDKEGSTVEAEYIDIQQLEVINDVKNLTKLNDGAMDSGGKSYCSLPKL